MADNYVGNVLAILRLLKNTPQCTAGHAPISFIHQWSGNPTDQATLRISAYILDQILGAEILIQNSKLADEAKQGLLQTTGSLKVAFSLNGLTTAIQNHLPALDAALSSFAILASATGVGDPLPRVAELSDILTDIEQLNELFNDPEIDPLVRETALKHLAVLAALLNNVEAFGVDSAIAAYWEMVIRLKRAEKNATEDTKEKLKKVWPKIEQWAGRLTIIEQAMNAGTSILSDFSAAAQTLLPHLT